MTQAKRKRVTVRRKRSAGRTRLRRHRLSARDQMQLRAKFSARDVAILGGDPSL